MMATSKSVTVARLTRGIISLSAFINGCQVAQRHRAPVDNPVTTTVRARWPNAEVILVLTPHIPAAQSVLAGLASELEQNFHILTSYVDHATTPELIDEIVQNFDPRAIVLMNNPTVRLYRRYQALRKGRGFPPAVVVLTSYIERTSVGLQKFTGIAYEVPLVISLVNLRALVNRPIQKVGVIHRPEFADYIARQRALARMEQFELESVEVAGIEPRAIRQALHELRGADVIWVLNDNLLLRRRSITHGWLHHLRHNWVPVVANVASLVTTEVDFGTFAVLPDHHALGLQTANLLLDLAAAGWSLHDSRIELPISVRTVLQAGVARQRLKLNEAEVARVDRVIR